MNDIEFTNNLWLFRKIVDEQHTRAFHYKRLLVKQFPDFFDELRRRTAFLKDDCSILERLYCIDHKLTSVPDCPICHKNKLKFNAVQNRYSFYCSIKCQQNDPENRRKMREHFNVEKMVERSKKTRMEKYGGSYCPKDFRDKIKRTKLERHGDANYVNHEKALKTKELKYGSVEDAYKESISKGHETKQRLYGDANYNNRKKFKETLNSLSEDDWNRIAEQRKTTNMERYGGPAPISACEIRNQILTTVHERTFDNLSNSENEVVLLTPKDEFLNIVKDGIKTGTLKWKCTKCGREFTSPIHRFGNVDKNGNRIAARCEHCHPVIFGGTSEVENEIYDFVKNVHSGIILKGDRTVLSGLELDIYVPDRKLAIEVDGLFWHSESAGKNKDYHLNKTELCEQSGIHLIHLFENEWTDPVKCSIVESRIKTLLGMYEHKIWARECEVNEVSTGVSRTFLNANHLQGGKVNGSVNLGLFKDGEMISVMTFSKQRFNRIYEWELLRFATKKNFLAVGAAGKLLKFFERKYHPKSILSYADRRWTTVNNNVYEHIGFKLLQKTTPSYFYMKDGLLESRMKYQKHKLAKLLPHFRPELSEAENMKLNGYDRIFDCGNLVYVKNYVK